MSSASSPSDVNECRSEIVHAIHSFVQVLNTLGGLRWEEFKGECRFVLATSQGELGRDVHGGGSRLYFVKCCFGLVLKFLCSNGAASGCFLVISANLMLAICTVASDYGHSKYRIRAHLSACSRDIANE